MVTRSITRWLAQLAVNVKRGQLLFYFLFDSSDDYAYSDENNSSYCIYIYFPTIRYQIPYVIIISSECTIYFS